MKFPVAAIVLVFFVSGSEVFPQETPHPTPERRTQKSRKIQKPQPLVSETPSVESRKPRKKREKEIEGSQALNRFEVDSVLRSEYQHEGRRLEVDPD